MTDQEEPTPSPAEREPGAAQATLEPDASGEHAPAVEGSEAPALAAAKAQQREAMKTRVLIPLLLPLLAAAAILVYVLNLSRALLAGDEWGSLAIASIVTVVILFGAAWISARPQMRTSSLVLLVSSLFVLIVASGLTTLGPSEEHEAATTTGYVQPTGTAVDTLAVEALATTQFQAKAFTLKAGIVQVNYTEQAPQTHTLVFADPALTGFKLALPGGPKSGKVELKPGKYTIYCDIPGHRALGMEATVTVK